jgi:23S rRNA pseudouridine955/2504/2580 synthase
MSEVKKIVHTELPVRLDRYLRRLIPSATQGIIEKALRTGNIRLNGNKAKSNQRVNEGDCIVYLSKVFVEETIKQVKSFSQSTIVLAEKILSKYLIYSSPEFIAINKPSGLAVQGGSKISLSVDSALEYLNQTTGSEYKIVHRLDKETSGILLIARGYTNAAKLTKAFKDYLIEKKYIAVVSGIPKVRSGKLVNFIGKCRLGVFESVQELKKDGKKAETYYTVISSSESQSLIEFKPKTGRMHQLRFHAKLLGCPIIGDKKYGRIQNNRMLLHALEVKLHNSIFGNEIIIESELPFIFLQHSS